MTTVVVIVLAVVGLAASLSGAVGILRFPDVYCRIQASTKNVTLGALPALVAVVVGEGGNSMYAAKAGLVAFLLVVVSPIASHALARASWHAGIPQWSGAVAEPADPDDPDLPLDQP